MMLLQLKLMSPNDSVRGSDDSTHLTAFQRLKVIILCSKNLRLSFTCVSNQQH